MGDDTAGEQPRPAVGSQQSRPPEGCPPRHGAVSFSLILGALGPRPRGLEALGVLWVTVLVHTAHLGSTEASPRAPMPTGPAAGGHLQPPAHLHQVPECWGHHPARINSRGFPKGRSKIVAPRGDPRRWALPGSGLFSRDSHFPTHKEPITSGHLLREGPRPWASRPPPENLKAAGLAWSRGSAQGQGMDRLPARLHRHAQPTFSEQLHAAGSGARLGQRPGAQELLPLPLLCPPRKDEFTAWEKGGGRLTPPR